MEVTDEMLTAAVRKAVEVGLLPKAGFIDVVEVNWMKVKQVVQAAAECVESPRTREGGVMFTQFDRMKAMFDEFGVKYGVQEDTLRNEVDFSNTGYPDLPRGTPLKSIVTDEGIGYSGFMAMYTFTAEGKFVGYSVWE